MLHKEAKDERPDFPIIEDGIIPRVAAIHDICGYGAASLGIVLPILSCAGINTCPIPPSLRIRFMTRRLLCQSFSARGKN